MTEKRLFQRVRFAAETEAEINGTRHAVTLVDISLKGALLTFPDEAIVDKGAVCHLTLHLDLSDVTLSFTGMVAHSRDNLIGVKFITIGIDSMTHLRNLIELNSGDPDLVRSELNAFICTD